MSKPNVAMQKFGTQEPVALEQKEQFPPQAKVTNASVYFLEYNRREGVWVRGRISAIFLIQVLVVAL